MSDPRQKPSAPGGTPFQNLMTTPKRRHGSLGSKLRSYFLTGLVIAAPISITVYVTWWFIKFVDTWFKPLLPARYDPDTYLPFSIPGVGLVLALFMLTVLGALAANLFGRTIVGYGEQLLDQMPIVRNIYRGLKQIFETVLSERGASFTEVGLVEYPRKGLWALVFISTETKGEVRSRIGEGRDLVSVFLPTTPNPTSGFLLFVPRKDIMILEMSVEEAAKLVISAGLVTPVHEGAVTVGALGASAPAGDLGASAPAGGAQPAASSLIASSRSNT